MLLSRNNLEDDEGALPGLEKFMFDFWTRLRLSDWTGPVVCQCLGCCLGNRPHGRRIQGSPKHPCLLQAQGCTDACIEVCTGVKS